MADDDTTATTTTTEPPKKVPPKADPDEPKQEMFSREYVKELREENKSWRLKAQELESALAEKDKAVEQAQQQADEKVTEASKSAQDRIIRAELKAEALKAGMIDLDGLKLADLSEVTLSDDGNVEGAQEALERLKESKPYLFGEPSKSSSSTKDVPPKDDAKPKRATDMTPEEYQAAKAKITGKSKRRAY